MDTYADGTPIGLAPDDLHNKNKGGRINYGIHEKYLGQWRSTIRQRNQPEQH